MNYPILFRLLSTILGALTAAFTLSWGIGEMLDPQDVVEASRHPWLGSIGIMLLLTLGCWYKGRNAEPKIFRKEALAVTGLGWLMASILGAIPYYLLIEEATYADAFFESASGLTTTGASIFADVESLPLGLLFWRSLSQWIGGLGVIVFFVAILSYLGAGAKILYSNEASSSSAKFDSGRIQQGISRIVIIYLVLSVACTAALMFAGVDAFDAVCTMLATVSTGGFSNFNDSAAHFTNPAVQWILIAFMVIGGISFILMLRALSGKWRELFYSTETRAYLLILLVGSVALWLMLMLSGETTNPQKAFTEAVFQAVSITTTTGFATTNYDSWIPFGQVVIIMLIAVGGCSGSTSGGMKVIRMVVSVKSSLRQIEHAFRSRVVRPLYLNKRIISTDEQNNIRDFLLLAMLILIFGSILLATLEPHVSPEGVISAVLTCISNVGPGLNEVGPTMTFNSFSSPAKVFLALLMIMGRLEFYAILALFFPSLWKKFS